MQKTMIHTGKKFALNATLNSALQCHKTGNLEQAEKLYRQVLSQSPDHPDALHLMGFLAIQKGKNEEAVILIEKAIEKKPNSAAFYANYAVALQNTGRNEKAVMAGRKALELKPDAFNTYNTLGNALSGLERLDEAIENYQKSIGLNPKIPEAHFNLGNAFRKQYKFAEAAESYKQALMLKPDYAEAYFSLGLLFICLNDSDSAANSLLQAINAKNDYYEAYFNLGNVLMDQKKTDAAIACYEKALKTKPDYVEAYLKLGNVLYSQKEYDNASKNYQKAISLKPDFAEAYYCLGKMYSDQEKLNEAITNYEQAIKLRSDFAEAYNGIGNVFRFQGRFEDAMMRYEKALTIKPDFAEVYYNMSNIFLDQGKSEKAIENCKKALELKPDLAEAHWNMALALLTKGDLEHGWKKYEWRFLKKDAAPLPFPQPCWDGSDLKGKKLLVCAEQGVGDEIMFASCLPEVIAQTEKCIVECDERLVPLFARSFPEAVVTERINDNNPYPLDVSSADIKIAIGSLPQFQRTDFSRFPQKKSYLKPDMEKTDMWRNRFKGLGNGLKIGISWRGGKEAYVKRIRSINPKQWIKLFSISGIHFINLQYGSSPDELKEISESLGKTVHDWDDSDPLKDLDDFAAKISALDLVISVDNSTVHMAGALGVPVWTLLPAGSDWRWMQESEDTPWYPTMRLFRQSKFGDWKEVFEKVYRHLKALIQKRYFRTGVCKALDIHTYKISAEKIKSASRKNIILLNDTLNWYHWGCTGTSMAIHQAINSMNYDFIRVPISDIYKCKDIPVSIYDFDNQTFFYRFTQANKWITRAIQDSDIVVVNGEGSLHGLSPYVLTLLYLIYISKVRFMKNVQIINHSCYPAENDLTPNEKLPAWELYQKVYREVDFIAIREPVSYDLLLNAGIKGVLSFDCLPLYIRENYEIKHKRSTDRIVLSGSVAWQNADMKIFGDYINRLSKLGYKVYVLTGARAFSSVDEQSFTKNLSKVCPYGWTKINAKSMDEWLDAISGAAVLVSGRFHHTIAASATGTPFILFESNTNKNRGIAKTLNAPEPLRYDTADLHQLIYRTESVIKDCTSTSSNAHRAMVDLLCDFALKNFSGLKSIISPP